MDDRTTGQHRFGYWIAGVLVLAAGVCLWIHQAGRPAWTDEAWVVGFARESGWVNVLCANLDHRQPAAPGYLLLLHGCYRIGADWLWCYRLPSMLFGAVLLALSAGLIRRCGGGTVLAWLAALWLLLCPLLQRYMTEIKPYMAEAALTIALITLASAWLESSDRRVPWLGLLVALLALLLGFATWFAVLGTAAAMAMILLWRRDYRRLATLGWMALPVWLTAMLLYFLYVRYLLGNQTLYIYWWPVQTGEPSWLQWLSWATGMQYAQSSWYLFVFPRWLLVVCAWAGWLIWLRVQPTAAWTAGVIVLTTSIAMMAGFWPRGARVNLPIITIGHLAVCCGVSGLWKAARTHLAARHNTKRADIFASRNSGWLLLLVCAAALVWEGMNWDFTVARIDHLLDELARRSTTGQLVIMDSTSHLNQQYRPPLQAKIMKLSWPQLQDISSLKNLIEPTTLSNGVLLALGHHNNYAAQALQHPDPVHDSGCRIQPIWSDHLVALYQVEFAFNQKATSQPQESPAP